MIKRFFAVGALAGVFGVSFAGDLSSTGGFNALVFSNFNNQGYTDIEGRLAVGGDLNPLYSTSNPYGNPGYTVNGVKVAGTYGLVVRGNAKLNSATVNGSIYTGGDFYYNNPTVTGSVHANGSVTMLNGGSVSGSITYGTTVSVPNYFPTPTKSLTASPFDFDTAKSNLTALSQTLKNTTANATYTNSSHNLVLNATNSGLNVFSLSAADLASSVDLQIRSTNADATVVVNISGSIATMPSHGYSLSGIDGSRVVYNFADATSVSFGSIGINGSVLATKADVNAMNYGQLNGQLIANTWTGNMQINNKNFAGSLPNVAATPEPATLLLIGGGVAGAIRRRRKSTN